MSARAAANRPPRVPHSSRQSNPNSRQADVERQFPVAASLADDEASIAKVVGMADRIVPGHFPELKREGTVFTPVRPQSLEIQFK